MKNIFIYFMLCLLGLGIQSVQGMPIFVKISSETTITLELNPSDTVDNVKQIIQEQQGITQSQQILYFGTTKLEDIGTLSDYNILSGGTIVLITIHNIISVVSGTGFNIKTGTVVGAEGLDLTPSADFSLTSSLSGSDAVSKSTTITNINKSYRFSETTAGYSGLVKINYLDTELNSLSANGLKLLYNNGNAWAIDDNSTINTTDKYAEVSLTSKTLNELSLGNCIITDAPIVACYQTATWNPATCQYDITGTPTAVPTASAQTFCAVNTVADLVATGTNIKWYDVATEGTALATSTALVTGTTYYVSQTDNGCESARTSVAVTVNTTAAPVASAQTFCTSGTVANLEATGTNLKWYDVITDGTALATSTALVSGTIYYVSQTDNGCESARASVAVTLIPKPKQPGATVDINIVITGYYGEYFSGQYVNSELVNGYYDFQKDFYGSKLHISYDGMRWVLSYYGLPYFTSNSSASDGLYPPTTWPSPDGDLTWIYASVPVTLACYQSYVFNSTTCAWDITGTPTAVPTASAQTFCAGKTVADLVATGTNLKWYAVATEGTALATSTALVSGTTYYVSQTENGCESTRTSVAVTVITTPAPWASPQTFCGSKTVADLLSAGSDLKWYNVATNGTALEASASIATGTYYVSQTLNSCESKRTPVSVTVNNAVAGTVSEGQLIVRGTQPAAINLTGSVGSVQWQISLNNSTFTNIAGATGTTLSSDKMGILTSRKFYRAVVKSGDCSSATSEVVQVWTTLATKIQDSQCGQTLVNLNTNVSAIGVPGADYYRFKLVQGATTRIIVKKTKGFNLTSLEEGFLFNTTYTISVATQSIGLWSDYGTECTVTTPSGLTKIQNSQCGTTLASLTTNITADAVVGVNNYRFKVVQGETTRFLETTARYFNLKSLEGGVFYNTTYTVSVATQYNGNWSEYGTECSVSTPSGLTKIQNSQCGITLASLSTNVMADAVAGVNNYRFKVVQGETTRFFETTASYFNLKSLDGGVFYNTTYTVSVATKYNGAWSDYGTECTVTTPSGLTKIKDSQCGTTLASLSTSIAANAVTGVSNYSFKVVQGGTTRTIETGTAAFSLKFLVGGASSGTTYTISVATKYNGVWGEYGTECVVTTPGSSQSSVSRQAATATEIVSDAVSVLAYPSPFETTFKLDFQSSSESSVDVSVYDMIGRLLENQEVKSSEINNLELGNGYPSGVYNVIITQGIEVKTVRLIKK